MMSRVEAAADPDAPGQPGVEADAEEVIAADVLAEVAGRLDDRLRQPEGAVGLMAESPQIW